MVETHDAAEAGHGRTPGLRAVVVALVLCTGACGPRVEEEAPIPEYRIETCESWCSLMFDPTCPPQEIEVETERECVEVCAHNEVVWGETPDGDACAPTLVPYVDCLATMSCEEIQEHFVLANSGGPYQEQSSCGESLRRQLDCQLPFQ
ncbi:MAG: hypothetical protein H6712_30535 [Myxococcales bacterium]|nr:hypothetical protein [Myxococcales bacterium]MCB9718227.1 hypothetical protein [Myxococcales bacterium]